MSLVRQPETNLSDKNDLGLIFYHFFDDLFAIDTNSDTAEGEAVVDSNIAAADNDIDVEHISIDVPNVNSLLTLLVRLILL